ncbi:acetyltransferase (GNAT) family protein [Bacillus oleivorans]|uniref:Acetyltransferase (GNAT) family protein n=1 Tax=Bacillus oleivorans TaxID=1448271 RepID=A0A285CHK4_9BACI|nr:GNAT family N-acetyltransferase [Bacillus oleivorans]SNX67087.1 acetyltransferase (GNAT) family protein [Bacillus oleivorans]
MVLQVISLNEVEEKDKVKVDKFIMDSNSNGEFINTIKYLSYHNESWFNDDSVIVKDVSSGVIKSVMMAAIKKNDDNTIISHPGTTFSGPIFNGKRNFEEMEQILELILSYYDKKYKYMELKIQPNHYSTQPYQEVEYLLLKIGFRFGFTALSNVIDLKKYKEENDFLKLYNQKRRNQVKKSIKESNYTFTRLNNIDENIWTNMERNIRTKFETNTTHTYNQIVDLHDKFKENIVPYATYRKDGQYGAFALAFKFKNVFHTQYLDLNYELRQEYPNLFLIHTLVKEAISEGFGYFSFGASTENGGRDLNLGLYNYKSGFGGGSILLPVYKRKLR